MNQEDESFKKADERLTGDHDFRISELIVNGYGDEYTIPLDQDVVRIGRGKGNDVVLEDPELPFVHCEIWKQKDHYVLIDKDSEDGTLVNGDPVEFHVLSPGDRIQVGDASLTAVRVQQEEEPEPIDPQEAEAFFDEGPQMEMPTRTPGRRSVNGRDPSTPRSRSRSSLWTWAVIGGVILILGASTGYAYYQYKNRSTARELLERAESLKEDQRYKEALSLLSNRLLEEFSSSEVAPSARTLKRNVRTILNQRNHIRSRFNELKSTVPPPDAMSSQAKLAHVEDTLEKVNTLLKNNKRFLNRYFRPQADPDKEPGLLQDIRDLKASVQEDRNEIVSDVRQQHREQIKNKIDHGKYQQAMKMARSFDQSGHQAGGRTSSEWVAKARTWISKEYTELKERVVDEIQSGHSARGIKRFKENMDTFEEVIGKKQVASDLEALQERRRKAAQNDGNRTSSNQQTRGASVITGGLKPPAARDDQNETGSSDSESTGTSAPSGDGEDTDE